MLSAIFVMTVYKIAPVWMGKHALRTLAGKKLGVPAPVLTEVAQHAYKIIHGNAVVHRALSSKPYPYSQEVADFYNHLEYCATGIQEILSGRVSIEEAKTRWAPILQILQPDLK